MIFFACMILLMFVYFLYDIVWNDVGCLQLSLTIIVCHQTTVMHAPISKFGGSNHGSPVFIRFRYPMVNSSTHSSHSAMCVLVLIEWIEIDGDLVLIDPTKPFLMGKFGQDQREDSK